MRANLPSTTQLLNALFGATPENFKVIVPDDCLMQISPNGDYWSIKDSFEGCCILGETGSGKTSGSGTKIAKEFLRKGMGGIVLCVKTDEAEHWRKMAADCNRENDLVILNATNGYTFNFLEYEQSRSGQGAGLTENIAKLFLTVMEIGGRKNTKASDEYWTNTLRQLLRNTIDLLRLAHIPISVKAMHDLISTAPADMQDATSPEWVSSSYCGQMLAKAQSLSNEDTDWEITTQYWLQEFPQLAEKTRSIIVSSFTSIADNFNRSVLKKLFCTTTNITPEDCWKHKKIIVVDLNLKEFNEVGQQAQVMFKYVFQKAVERRNLQQYPQPVFLWADEAHFFIHAYDNLFTSTARSSRCATCYLSQSISSLYAAAGGESGKYEIDSLLNNLSTKIFHANSDAKTNEYAANLIGKTKQMKPGYSKNNDGKHDRTNINFSEHYDYQAHPIEFVSLKKGGIANEGIIQAIIFQGGRLSNATGKNYFKVKFRQAGF